MAEGELQMVRDAGDWTTKENVGCCGSSRGKGQRAEDKALFSAYMRLTGVPSVEGQADLRFSGRRVGIVNGSSWITLWSTWFGRKYLPGAELVNAGNQAVQLNFMEAHQDGRACPPRENIDATVEYARQLVTLAHVDGILLTCSTMNRAAPEVTAAMAAYGVPVIQIDEAMMEQAVRRSGTVLVIATHGPTVANTHALLRETAARTGADIRLTGATVEHAFELLGRGEIERHNEVIADAIRKATAQAKPDTVVLAQLSMGVFSLSYPDPVTTFGCPVLNSGDCGFRAMAELLANASDCHNCHNLAVAEHTHR
jgi:hypothetical protein